MKVYFVLVNSVQGWVMVGGGIFWVDWGGWTFFVGEWGWVDVGRGAFLVDGCVWTFFMVG